MKRRAFITLLGGAAAWPLAARAQQSAMPVIGVLNGTTPVEWAPFVTAWRRGLSESGFVEGRNVDIVYEWAEGQPDRLPTMAAGLVRRQVSVIVASGGGAAVARAAKQVTTTIPIVFVVAGDPVRLGLVAALNRPGGNVTGINLLLSESGGKRLELLRELLPKATTIGWLVNPDSPPAAAEVGDVEAMAANLGLHALILEVRSERDVDNAFATLVEQRAEAVIVIPDAFVLARRHQLAELSARHGLATIYAGREFVLSGGLISYGTSIVEGYRLAGDYVARILKGARPADLPVQQPTKFELVINLKTAKALGLEIPPTVLARADEVIE
jgi:putative tryptophan/tyrosine transport system substrate-binding protein